MTSTDGSATNFTLPESKETMVYIRISCHAFTAFVDAGVGMPRTSPMDSRIRVSWQHQSPEPHDVLGRVVGFVACCN